MKFVAAFKQEHAQTAKMMLTNKINKKNKATM
jgi:hypothetical protein